MTTGWWVTRPTQTRPAVTGWWAQPTKVFGAAALTATATNTAGLRKGIRAGAARTETATLSAVGNMAARGNATRAVTAALTASGGLRFSRTASRTVTAALTAAGTAASNVSYDTTGAGNKGTGSTLSWSHTVSAGAKAVLVGVNTGGGSAAATFGGTAMTQLAQIQYQTSFALYLYIFGLLTPPTGTQTVSLSGLATGSNANSVSYLNVSSFGTGVTTSATSGTTLSQTVSAAAHDMVFQVFGSRSATAALTGYNQTSRFSEYTNGTDFAILIGDAPGAASVSFSATANASGAWGSAAVPLNP